MLPRTIWVDDLDANARNWPHKIKMRRGLDHPKAIWSQEFFESRFKLSILIVAFLLISASAFYLPVGLFGLFLMFTPMMPPVERFMELIGHEIEVQAAQMLYGADEDVYRRNEARALMNYPTFSGRQRKQIEQDMRKRTSFAVQFVNHNRKKIEKHGTE